MGLLTVNMAIASPSTSMEYQSSQSIPFALMRHPYHYSHLDHGSYYITQGNNYINVVKRFLQQSNINVSTHGPYLKVQIQDFHDKHNTYLLVYLLDKNDLKVEIIRIDLNAQGDITSVHRNYRLNQNDINQQPTLAPNEIHCPDPTVQFVAASTMYGGIFPIVTKTIDNEIKDAQNDHLRTHIIKAKDASSVTYKNWLSCPNLEGFSNISHGYKTGGLDLNDRPFLPQAIPKFNNSKHTIVTFDSCSVLSKDSTLMKTMENKGVQQFSGGITPLNIWGSTLTYGCVWHKLLTPTPTTPIDQALKQCEIQFDPTVPKSTAGVYIANMETDETDKTKVYPLYIKTYNSSTPIVLKNNNNEYHVFKLASDDSIQGLLRASLTLNL